LREIDASRSRNYLKKSEDSLRMAKIALENDAYDNAVMSSVHSAINALDALTTYYLGKRSSGSHTNVLILIKGIFGEKDHSDIGKQFSSLLSLKNASEYQPDLMKKSDAEISVQRAERIFGKSKKQVIVH
jgi:uncharacterized protein (UPF0332 family)